MAVLLRRCEPSPSLSSVPPPPPHIPPPWPIAHPLWPMPPMTNTVLTFSIFVTVLAGPGVLTVPFPVANTLTANTLFGQCSPWPRKFVYSLFFLSVFFFLSIFPFLSSFLEIQHGVHTRMCFEHCFVLTVLTRPEPSQTSVINFQPSLLGVTDEQTENTRKEACVKNLSPLPRQPRSMQGKNTNPY